MEVGDFLIVDSLAVIHDFILSFWIKIPNNGLKGNLFNINITISV